MSAIARLFLADAFTTQRGGGNPAHVLLLPRRLAAWSEDTRRLLSVTQSLGKIDCAFAFEPEPGDEGIDVRFCTPHASAPFVGHASIALHAVRDALGMAPAALQRQSEGATRIARRCAPGPIEYVLELAVPPLGAALTAAELHALCKALDIGAAPLDAECPAIVAGGTSKRVLLGLADAADLAKLSVDATALSELSRRLGVGGVLVYARATANNHTPASANSFNTEARMFAPALGIAEDPVSGNAHLMLAAYLRARGLLSAYEGGHRLRGRQGHHLGRAGAVCIEMPVAPDSPPSTLPATPQVGRLIGSAVVHDELPRERLAGLL